MPSQDAEMPIPESDETLEGAMGGDIDCHTSREQNDLESDSKGNLQHILSPNILMECVKK